MKKTYVFLVVSLTVLSACGDHGKVPLPADSSTQTVNAARERAKQVCKYLPTVKTILEILELGVPHLSKAAKIGDAICAAVESGSKGGTVPRVNGVRIRGKFVS